MFQIYKQKIKFPFRLFLKYGFVVPGKEVLYRIRNNIFSKHPAKATLARRLLISRKILLLKRRISKELSYLIVKVSKTGKLQSFRRFRIFGATSKFLSSKYKVHPKTQKYLNRVIEQRRQCLNVTKEGAIKPSMNFNCELILHKVDVQNLPMFGTFCCETEFDGYTVYTLNVESRQLDDVPAWTILQDEMPMDQENFQNVIAKNQIKKIIEENRTVVVSLPQSLHDNNNHKTIKDEPLEKEIYTERSMRVRGNCLKNFICTSK